jgi:hypothetical protein
LCRQAPPVEATALPEPKADKFVVDAAMAKLVKEAFTNRDPKLWAKKLKARHQAGEKLSPILVKAYREALDDTFSKVS